MRPWLLSRQNEDTASGGNEAEEEDSTAATTTQTTAQNPGPTNPVGGPNGNDGVGRTGSVGDDDERFISFNNEENFEGDQRIFDPQMSETTFNWQPKDPSMAVLAVIWLGQNTTSGSYVEIAESKFDAGEQQYMDDVPLTKVNPDMATLTFSGFSEGEPFENFRANRMAISIRWSFEDEQISGVSTSGIFTVGSPLEDGQRLARFSRQLATDEEAREGSEVQDTGSGMGRNGDSETSSTAATTAESTGAVPSLDSNDDDDGGGGGGGGLSTGAIAGIAVGSVVFVALIAGLIFFFLRRRRRGQDRGQYNNPTTSTTFMAGDKEVHQITETPHSTYSNDQQVPLSNLAAAGEGSNSRHMDERGLQHQHSDDDEAEYAPYRDDAAAGHSGGGPGTPHGVSRSVAHLVEEGMTEDEIRRLEEEERQLDDAIERHGQRRT